MRAHLAECPVCAAEHARLAGLPSLLALADGLEEKPTAPPGDRGAPARRGGAGAPLERPPAALGPAPVLRPAAPARARGRRLRRGGARRGRARLRARRRRAGAHPRLRGGDEAGRRERGDRDGDAPQREERHRRCTCRRADLAGDPSIVYEVLCEGGGSTESAGTFRANAAGHAYAVLQTALRRGEYDVIRVVRKQRDMQGRVQVSRRTRGAAARLPDLERPEERTMRIAIPALLAALVLALAGCGGSDNKNAGSSSSGSSSGSDSGGGGEQLALSRAQGRLAEVRQDEAHRQGGQGHDRLRQRLVERAARRRDRGQRRRRGERHGDRRQDVGDRRPQARRRTSSTARSPATRRRAWRARSP